MNIHSQFFQDGGRPIGLVTPELVDWIPAPDHIKRPDKDTPKLEIRHICIQSLTIETSGMLNSSPRDQHETKHSIDLSKWGIKILSDLQNKLHGTSVSKSPTDSVFIPISATGIKMMAIRSNPHIDQITPASVICIVLQAIKSIAKPGAEWMKHVFVLRRYLENGDEYFNDNEIMLLAHETAVAALTSTVVTLRIREALGQGRSAGANFNFHVVEIYGIKISIVTN